MIVRLALSALVLCVASCSGVTKPLDVPETERKLRPAAAAVMQGLIFEGAKARSGLPPETTDDDLMVDELDGPFSELELEPGSSGRYGFDIGYGDRESDPVVSTLLHVEGARSYVEIPIANDESGALSYRVTDAICDQVCAYRYELYLEQSFRTEDGDIGRFTRTRRLVLDCRASGVEDLACDGALAPMEEVDSGTGGEGGEGGASGATAGGSGGLSGGGIGPAGEGGEGGDTGGSAGIDSGEQCLNVGEDNISCPDVVGPFTGPCAPKGSCCQRSSNNAKLSILDEGESVSLEYRVAVARALNHPFSISLPLLRMVAADRARSCAGEQCRLWRFSQPRRDSSEGFGLNELGIGRYNCDGTYSYYSEIAAPSRPSSGLTDPARWQTQAAQAWVDRSLVGVDRSRPVWATNPNRHLGCAPYFLPGSQTIDWEECTSGFEILEIDTSEAGNDCQGSWDGSDWQAPGRFQTFVPLFANAADIIDSILQSYCQLLAFSVLTPDDRDRDCQATPRCMPGSSDCKFVKLPDSLCPESDGEAALFGCHLGAEGNPNQEESYPADLNCTPEEPTAALDSDADPTVSKGQCCDPLGSGESGLPACNAYRIVYEYAASAVEITDETASELPPVCQ